MYIKNKLFSYKLWYIYFFFKFNWVDQESKSIISLIVENNFQRAKSIYVETSPVVEKCKTQEKLLLSSQCKNKKKIPVCILDWWWQSVFRNRFIILKWKWILFQLIEILFLHWEYNNTFSYIIPTTDEVSTWIYAIEVSIIKKYSVLKDKKKVCINIKLFSIFLFHVLYFPAATIFKW